MKSNTIATILLGFLLVTQPPVHGQVIVHDPGNAQIEIANHLEEIVKLVKLIEEIKTTKNWLGNAAEILDLAGMDELMINLESEGVGLSRVEIATAATSFDGTTYDGHGLYTPVGETWLSRSGQFITRPDVFKPEAAIFNAARDYDAVSEDVKTRRAALRSGMQKTASQMQAATTHVEALKATGVLIAQHAELDATDREQNQAAEKVEVTAQVNEAAKELQEKARNQEQAVEFDEALQEFIKMLRPPSFVPEVKLPAKGGSGAPWITPINKTP